MASLISRMKHTLKHELQYKKANTMKPRLTRSVKIQSSILAPVSSLTKFSDPVSASPKLDQSTYTFL